MRDNTIRPKPKAPEHRAFLDSMTGVPQGQGICVICKSDRMSGSDFRDEQSREEARISGMCQPCQDKVWGVPA